MADYLNVGTLKPVGLLPIAPNRETQPARHTSHPSSQPAHHPTHTRGLRKKATTPPQ